LSNRLPTLPRHPFVLPKEVTLSRITLIREIYRALINTGRSYAAFTQKERELVDRLKSKGEIFDPMSGYGLLMRYCSTAGIKSFGVEYNLPQYLWQLLCHPSYSEHFLQAIKIIRSRRARWPRTVLKAVVSDEFFPEASLRILERLLRLTKQAIEECFGEDLNIDRLALALLLPFAGRLSCSVPGDISTHTKVGGMCIFSDWEKDYEAYLRAAQTRLEHITLTAKTRNHKLMYGDARIYKFPKRRFRAMITSPPYPNHRDFTSMFAPEHALLHELGLDGNNAPRQFSEHIIGSNFVSNRPKIVPESKAALHFLNDITKLERNKTATYDDEVYYIPYFENYFIDLEKAYKNVSSACANADFEGYIVVVNNTHRNLVIPVSEVILEIWTSLGFNATVSASNELFHIGTKNPRARGLRAKHMEYIIKVWR
jgi:hypothetical protein